MESIVKNLEREISLLEGATPEKTQNPYPKLTQKVVVSHGAIESSYNLIAEICPDKYLTIIADDNTYAAAGERIEELISSKGFQCDLLVLEAEDGSIVEPLADTVESLIELVDEESNAVLSVGSGSITDIGKALSAAVNKPQIALATAPSVNGFTSNFASLIRDGLKETTPAPAPVLVIADTEVLAKAPLRMIAAGFGDLCSRPVSAADWKLASIIYGMEFNAEAVRLASISFDAIRSLGENLHKRNVEAIGVLTRALMLSGFSMSVAGSSSPASGGEHLISHYWDMNAIYAGSSPPSLHGLQVGIASLVTSALFEILASMSQETIDIEKIMDEYPSQAEFEDILKYRHGDLYDAVKETAIKKYLPAEKQRERLEYLKARWEEMWTAVRPELLPTQTLARMLQMAGCPIAASEIELSRNGVMKALCNARDIRVRFSVLDVAHDLGLLEEIAEEVIDLSGVAME